MDLPLGPTVVHSQRKNNLDAQGGNSEAERPRGTIRFDYDSVSPSDSSACTTLPTRLESFRSLSNSLSKKSF